MKETAPVTKDPICGMTVDKTTAIHGDRDGETFYFCSDHCRQEFLSTPAATKQEEKPQGKAVYVRPAMTTNTARDKAKERDHRTWSIGSQLLLSVNGVLVLLAAIFLTYDYRRDLGSRLEDKRIALYEEAKTMMPAVLQIQQLGREKLQRYVDAVCGRMRDSESPGHHIVVDTGTDVIQASAHHRASPEILLAMKAAARHPRSGAKGGDDGLVVGTYSQGETVVYVAETLKNIRNLVVDDVILRLMALIVLAFAATVVVDYVLWRVVWRPIKQLVITVHEIAKGNLGAQTGSFQCKELDFLAGEINEMSASLAAVDRERASQMVKAREIQQSLLPKNVNLAGLNISSLFLPAEEVAGDFFDVITLKDGTHVVCIADVTGHGVPAAMSAMMLKVLLGEACEHHADPSEILAFINHRLTGVCHTDGFVTMFATRLDTRGLALHYASAGHESGLLLPAEGELATLPSTGMVLGVIEGERWATQTLAVGPGDRLLLVTDGVTEAMNPKEQMFGRKRLADSFEACRDTDISGTLWEIGSAVAAYCENRPYSDDVTLLAIEVS